MEFLNVYKKLEKNFDYYAKDIERKCGMEKDDAKQELLLRCLEVKEQYDSNRGQENTFFITVLKNQAKRIIQKSYSDKKRKPEVLFNDFNMKYLKENNLEKEENSILCSEIDFENKVITMQIFNKIKNKLEGKSKLILEGLMMNEDHKQIAEKLKTSTHNVYNIIRRKIRPIVDLEF
jgi:RNA polymerase sigma factor (sigma-70 family)